MVEGRRDRWHLERQEEVVGLATRQAWSRKMPPPTSNKGKLTTPGAVGEGMGRKVAGVFFHHGTFCRIKVITRPLPWNLREGTRFQHCREGSRQAGNVWHRSFQVCWGRWQVPSNSHSIYTGGMGIGSRRHKKLKGRRRLKGK